MSGEASTEVGLFDLWLPDQLLRGQQEAQVGPLSLPPDEEAEY